MRLIRLRASLYRSLREVAVEMNGLNLFIGANASGKSTVLDALRFLHEGVRDRKFGTAVRNRGGIINLPWKGGAADHTELVVEVESGSGRHEWSLRLVRVGYEFYVEESVSRVQSQSPPVLLLKASKGDGWWWSGEQGKRVVLKQSPTMCALAAAAADASFPARDMAEFVGRWGFFDPNPFLLRRDWTGMEFGRFDPYGRNLGETLYSLKHSAPGLFERIVGATRDVLGMPSSIEPRESDDRFYFVQHEPGLKFPCPSDGGFKRHAANAGVDDGALRGAGGQPDWHRGAGELRASNSHSVLRRVPSQQPSSGSSS